ncbi:MAG: hypothetical protein M1817_002889 [Caeruleum heppii]|nr:MAG: hypothetical protein M1817_002889 [Caeruleum heppii]
MVVPSLDRVEQGPDFDAEHRTETDAPAGAMSDYDEAAANELDMTQQPSPEGESETANEQRQLQALTENIRDQDELERDVAQQADQMLLDQADDMDRRRIEKLEVQKEKLSAQERRLQARLSNGTGAAASVRVQAELADVRDRLQEKDNDIAQCLIRIEKRHQDTDDAGGAAQSSSNTRRLPHETQREFLVRTGKITPFAAMNRMLHGSGSSLQETILEAEDDMCAEDDREHQDDQQIDEPLSHQNLRMPGFADELITEPDDLHQAKSGAPRKRRRIEDPSITGHQQNRAGRAGRAKATDNSESTSDSTFTPDVTDGESLHVADHDDDETSESVEDALFQEAKPRKRKQARPRKLAEHENIEGPQKEDLSGLDDGNERIYNVRLSDWVERRSRARMRHRPMGDDDQAIDKSTSDEQDHRNENASGNRTSEEQEWFLPHPTRADTEIQDGIRIPGDIYPSLFDYQKTGVQWLCELYTQGAGGIIGDEMGLGKTIQVIAFLAGLHHSKQLNKPIIVVTPATVMKQWVNEFHRWWPPLRVSILHTSGSGMLNVRGEDRFEQRIEDMPGRNHVLGGRSGSKAAQIVQKVLDQGHVLVTTYAGLQTYANLLIPIDWEYAVLDEGHKIRNPDAAITIHCKELRTPNRIILSGTPMQNNLTELWSLFDFVFPMRLGPLSSFKYQFEVPIKLGGYANASNLEVQTAVECAAKLKDAISPFLLQRLKVDVAADLPKKSEQVLFCKLTKSQRQAYEDYLTSADVRAIMAGDMKSFAGIEKLRKICNHPDLVDRAILKTKPGYVYGHPAKSGKMQVVKALLEVWKNGGHKTLLFAQQKIVLDILEKFIKTLDGIAFRRMDGDTPIERRQDLVDEFNNAPNLHVFLLTTKVGGLGVNLTGADRVIIFDPDWNPSTDTQARERAWRLGQKREVTIYRLMTAGTIEEKIYHRQLFKQFLANKILKDPNQRQSFLMKDLHDLFSFGGETAGGTETGDLFQGTEKMLEEVDEKRREDGQANGVGQGDPTSTLRQMAGVAGLEEYVDPTEGTTDESNEARLMEGILAGSGVQSALEHDQIINGRKSKKVQADPEGIKREAQRYAEKAASQLLKESEAARDVPIGTPTWTGVSGVTGRPRPVNRMRNGGRGGPSSASVLAGLQSRQDLSDGSGSGIRSGTPGQRVHGRAADAQQPDFPKLVRDFFLRHGGQVPSQMLVDHFDRLCRTDGQREEFKALLKQVATLEKGQRTRGRWTLKEEYR